MNKHVCNNCNKFGHLFHQCRIPITSYGIIVYRKNPESEQTEFLMIRRKDTFGYIDFMRGKYQIYNSDKIQSLINEMSLEERVRLTKIPFSILWHQLWGETHIANSRPDENTSMRKFEMLVNDDIPVKLSQLIENSTTNWTEPEWEFPKGRRNYHEKDLECALREFCEETGYNRNKISIVENIIPYEEIFIGSNNKSYKHKYFLAQMPYSTDAMPTYQTTEVSKTEWKTLDECLQSIRPYSLEKKKIITNVSRIIDTHILL